MTSTDKQNASGNLWQLSPEDRQSNAPLEGDVSTDVVIIGGGYTGLSAALHIAQKGRSVCVLEAKTVGHGGSGRNVGYVNAGLWMPPDEVEKHLGGETGAKLNALLAEGPDLVFGLIGEHQIRCDAVRQATLHCAASERGVRDLKNRYDQQIARGAPVRLLNKSETEKRTGSGALFGALLDPRAGTIQPLAYAQGLARAASGAGARIYENTTAASVCREGSDWVVTTAKGRVRAEKLIQATNAYGTSGIPMNDVVPVYFFQMATKPLSETERSKVLPGLEGCWDTAMVMSSFRLDADGRLLIGGVGNLEGPGRRIHRSWARRKLAALFPQLAGLEFDYEWCGRIGMTSDHLPKVVGLGPSAVSIFGYSGRGISPGTVFGKCAAEWATNGNEAAAFPVPIEQPGTSSFSRLKAMYFETGAILTHFVSAR